MQLEADADVSLASEARVAAGNVRARPRDVLSGSLSEVSVPELLQIVALLSARRVGIHLRSPEGKGRIWVDDDAVLHAEAEEVSGKRALRTLFGWREGTFRVSRETWPGAPSVSESIERCLLDGVLYQDLHEELTSLGPSFFVDRERMRNVEVHDRGLLVLALVEAVRDLREVLERSPLSDLETLEVLSELCHAGIVTGSD